MAPAGQQRLPIRRNVIGVRIAFRQFRQPLCGGLFHLALCQLPYFHGIHGSRQSVPRLSAFCQKRADLITAFARSVLRAGPGQDAVCGQRGFPPVGQQQTQPSPLFFHDPGGLQGIALQKFHDASRARIPDKSRVAACCHAYLSRIPPALTLSPRPGSPEKPGEFRR